LRKSFFLKKNIQMNINLSRPIAFFDLESTGVDVSKDRIVEISIQKLMPNGDKETFTKRVNPEMPIPIEASEVHGIYDFDVLEEKTWKEIAPEVVAFIGNADLAGYNSNRFDIPMLMEELLRVEVEMDMKDRKRIDVQNIFYKQEKRTLEAALKFYCNKELENAHSAEADTTATMEVLLAQIDRYEDIEGNVDFLSEYSEMGNKIADYADGEPCFNFGKHKGKTIEEVLRREPSYYSWMMQGDFPRYTKKVLQEVKENM
jgi:DNA polymerase III subunit epsilon